jgi:hypothetical protein
LFLQPTIWLVAAVLVVMPLLALSQVAAVMGVVVLVVAQVRLELLAQQIQEVAVAVVDKALVAEAMAALA